MLKSNIPISIQKSLLAKLSKARKNINLNEDIYLDSEHKKLCEYYNKYQELYKKFNSNKLNINYQSIKIDKHILSNSHSEKDVVIFKNYIIDFDLLYNEIKPDFVFNCSHIHGVTADLPLRVAKHLNIPTGVFLFSWDNLSSRSRIFPDYEKYFVWTKSIKNHLIDLYKGIIDPSQIIVTGTPQFDFHFDKKYEMKKSKLFKNIGLDLNRPFILYTTGKSSDFPDEHGHSVEGKANQY